ncbi:MAG TPA: hypothetical protein VFZ24_12580 [Longimicrobiales bacterium]
MKGRGLRALTIANAVMLAAILVSGFGVNTRQKFEVLDVERINVVDSAGVLRLVITNQARSPGLIEHGEEITSGGGRAGLLFYNEEETEAGGLIVSGRTANGRRTAVGSLTFDQYERDQALALQYVDDNGTRRAGLAVIDYRGDMSTKDLVERSRAIAAMPDGPERTAARRELQRLGGGDLRLYAGRSRDDGASLISMHDGSGRTRLRLRVDTLGAAVIEFLNSDGSVARTISP